MTKNASFAPSVGAFKTPKNVRRNLNDLTAIVVKTDLDLHIVRLLELHPQLKVRFRNHDLASLDVATKRTLLADMNKVLGVTPLKKSNR